MSAGAEALALAALFAAGAWGVWRLGRRPLRAMADRERELRRRLKTQRLEARELQEEVEELQHLKDDFLSTVNHQFRTPMTTLLEGVELLADSVPGPVSEDQRTVLNAMLESAKRLMALTEQVLNLGRLKSGRQVLERRPADLNAVLLRAADAWEPLGTGCHVRVVAGRLPHVYMDPDLMGQVLDHLLGNALHHAPAGTDVTVDAQARDAHVEVCIRDRGPGLSEVQVKQLFQPFVHLHTPEAPGAAGSGLGLAFCAHVIARHRGTIRAASSAQGGTAITFTVPVATQAFLLEDACRLAAERAEAEEDAFALLLVVPAGRADGVGAPTDAVRTLETTLHRHTHRGDQFVSLDDLGVVIVAVVDEAGLQAMARRLRAVLDRAGLEAEVAVALAPVDGTAAQQLLDVARHRLGQEG